MSHNCMSYNYFLCMPKNYCLLSIWMNQMLTQYLDEQVQHSRTPAEGIPGIYLTISIE